MKTKNQKPNLPTHGTEVGTQVEGNTKPQPVCSRGKATNKSNTGKKCRNWFVTVNNYTDTDVDRITACINECRYLIWQFEVGKECGTPHFHLCIVYDNARVWPKKYWPTAHIEPVRELEECIQYCSKEETRVDGPYEHGDRPKQGRRKDLEAIANEVVAGRTLKDIAREDPVHYVRYCKGLKLLREEIQEHRNSDIPPTIFWLWGLSGTGKTRTVTTLFKGCTYVKDGTQWWDNYDHEMCILIDDFDGKWPFRDLLRLLDRNAYQGQFKGGYSIINSPYIFITCEFPPWHYWQDNYLKQVCRRLTDVIECKEYEQVLKQVSDKIYM